MHHTVTRMPFHDMIGTAELARQLGCDRSTITRKIKTGALEPSDRMAGYNGDYLFSPERVLELVSARSES